MSKLKNPTQSSQFEVTVWTRSRPLSQTLVGLFLAALGSFTLAWVGQLTWHDITTWGKDIVLIFFGSRTTEHISLGIGMRVIHYFLIGLALLLPGLVALLRRKRKCPHYFGYLANHPKNAPISQECLSCTHSDCIATLTRQPSLTQKTTEDTQVS